MGGGEEDKIKIETAIILARAGRGASWNYDRQVNRGELAIGENDVKPIISDRASSCPGITRETLFV